MPEGVITHLLAIRVRAGDLDLRSDASVTADTSSHRVGAGLNLDPDEFATEYRLHRDQVYRYLLYRTGNREDAADLTQQVFLKAFRSLHLYRKEKGSFQTWVFTIAKNTGNSFGSRHKTTISWDWLSDSEWLLSDKRQNPVLDDSQTLIAELDELRQCLSQLDPKAQELVLLRFQAGLKVPEIASVVGKSDEAVKKSLQRTLKQLKDMYRDDTQ